MVINKIYEHTQDLCQSYNTIYTFHTQSTHNILNVFVPYEGGTWNEKRIQSSMRQRDMSYQNRQDRSE